MKTIVITGQSGSGKSYLANKLSKIFCNSIVIKTDSYYRDNILIKLLSILVYYIYDIPLSIRKNELMNTLKSINQKDRLVSILRYDFSRKNSSKSKLKIEYEEDNQFLIIEGIFAHRLKLNYDETINIVCEEEKGICFKRRLKRDQLERGRDSKEVYKKFNKSWSIFNKHIKKFIMNYNILLVNPKDQINYNNLLVNLKKQKNN
tara:strand:+ start:661 stop:1272 length:612 start_codon:yes stop_codon:yes gene_type:complete